MLTPPSLEKPDAAHPLQQRAEARAQTIMGFVWGSYGVLALLTLMFQLVVRLQDCTGVVACAAGLGKAAIWAPIWPFYWIFYLNG
jgi:hypothetical protein